MKHGQKGTTMVEFAIVALVFFMILFGIIEFGRAFFAWNTLNEVTRRGARVAAVTSPDNVATVKRIAVFADADGPSPVLPGLSTSNVQVRYLNQSGGNTSVFNDIRYVEVTVTGYQHYFMVPGFYGNLTVPDFKTVLPRESLGGY